MRQYVIAAAIALGLVIAWAAVLPLAAGPADLRSSDRADASGAPILPRHGASHGLLAADCEAADGGPPSAMTGRGRCVGPISDALSLCRGRNSVDQICMRALMQAVVHDAEDDASGELAERRCPARRQVLASLDRPH